MGDFEFPEAVDPERWTLVFHRKAQSRLFSLIALGTYKHVSAFAYLPGLKGWVLFDWQFRRARVVVLPDSPEAKAILLAIVRGNEMVDVVRKPGRAPFPRCFCTGAVKHLLGIQSRALRPDALLAHLRRHGNPGNAQTYPDGRPQPASPGGPGAG